MVGSSVGHKTWSLVYNNWGSVTAGGEEAREQGEKRPRRRVDAKRRWQQSASSVAEARDTVVSNSNVRAEKRGGMKGGRTGEEKEKKEGF